MSFAYVLFVIIILIAIIGVDNILKFILIAGGIALLIFIVWKIYDNASITSSISRTNYQQMEYKKSYFAEGHEVRPPVTGDYFKYSYGAERWTCQYNNTSICANCSRREEHKINDLYYYGSSYSRCTEINDDY